MKHSEDHVAESIKPLLTCEKCGYSTRYKQTLQEHIDREHESNEYPCDQCGFIAKSKRRLQEHKVDHVQGQNHECIECNKTFETTKQFKKHIYVVHKKDQHPKHEKPILCCDKCGYQTKWKASLEEHNEREHMSIEYPCDLCDHVARTKRKLQEHKNNHGQIHSCEPCGRIFETQKKLNKHNFDKHRNKPF